MKPKVGEMKVDRSQCIVKFDAGDQDPVEIWEAFERMLKDWPASRVPLKLGDDRDAVCGCGAVHGGWVCSHCTASRRVHA